MSFSSDVSIPAPGEAPSSLLDTFGIEQIASLVGPDSTGPLGVAVSGGSDSTALLAIAAAWGRAYSRPVRAVTIDHGLRPEAAEEAEFAGEIARSLDVPHDVVRWRPPSEGAGQAQARRARHRLLAEWADAAGVSRLATGHTQDDRLETLLLRARAGSGWYGLAAPEPISASPAWPEGRDLKLVRPLLEVSRADLRKRLGEAGLSWRDDPSNRSEVYERVRMRRVIATLPPLRRVSMTEAIRRLAAMRDAYKHRIQALADDSLTWLADGSLRLDPVRLAAGSDDVVARLLQLSLMVVSGRETAPSLDAAENLRRRLGSGDTAATLGGAWARVEEDCWQIARAPVGEARTPGAGAPRSAQFEPGRACVWDGRFLIVPPRGVGAGEVVDHETAARLKYISAAGLPANPARRTLPVLLAGGGARLADLEAGEGFYALALHESRFRSVLSTVSQPAG